MYRRYQAELYRLALPMVKSPDMANDVVHEVFRRILEHPERPVFPDKEKTYLRRATYREALHQIGLTQTRIEQQEQLRCELPIAAPAPIDVFQIRVLAELIDQAVSELPLRYQRAFRLRCISGCTRSDTARQMRISSKAVDEEVRRAKAMLREQLKEAWLEWRWG